MERPIHLICSFVNAYFNDSFRIHNKWKWVYGENEELGQGSDLNLPGGSIRPPDDPCNCYLSILVFLEWWATLVGDFILGTSPIWM